MPNSPVQLAIAEWQNKQITGTELMRRLVSFDKWMLPVSEAAAAEMVNTGAASRLMYSQDGEGVSRLYLFSDGEAYDAFRQSWGRMHPNSTFYPRPGHGSFNFPWTRSTSSRSIRRRPGRSGITKSSFPGCEPWPAPSRSNRR